MTAVAPVSSALLATKSLQDIVHEVAQTLAAKSKMEVLSLTADLEQFAECQRVMDAARLLPVVGAFLWFIPILWQSGDGGQATSRAIGYIFGVWVLLCIGAALVSVPLRAADKAEDRGEQ